MLASALKGNFWSMDFKIFCVLVSPWSVQAIKLNDHWRSLTIGSTLFQINVCKNCWSKWNQKVFFWHCSHFRNLCYISSGNTSSSGTSASISSQTSKCCALVCGHSGLESLQTQGYHKLSGHLTPLQCLMTLTGILISLAYLQLESF